MQPSLIQFPHEDKCKNHRNLRVRRIFPGLAGCLLTWHTRVHFSQVHIDHASILSFIKQITMKKFIVLYHAPADAMAQTANSTPEEQAKGMEAWMAWSLKCGDKLVDLGSPLMNGKQLKPNGENAGSGREVAGYSVLQAESMDEAVALMQGHPHLGWNADCSIEVHETMPLPGM
jgi:hypothetical protein